MEFIFLIVSFVSSVIGSICGIGGGVIMKPLLDALKVMGISSISFLSGCTVLTMSFISVMKNRKGGKSSIDIGLGTPLAIGAAAGGLIGKSIFEYACRFFSTSDKVGLLQSGLLAIITIGTLLYTIFDQRITKKHITNKAACVLIGILLGMLSSFLGIGGGPINLMFLSFFFSMEMKKAAVNSLYIILFSQIASLLQTLLSGTIPQFKLQFLILMVAGGILGGNLGHVLNKKISAKTVHTLFCVVMILIILINIYNTGRFGGIFN